MTDDQHPWPEELREMLNDWLDDAYESTEPRPNADALLAALAASPYAVVRRDEYGALRSFWSYTESGMDIVALSPAEELRAIYAERTGGSDE